MFLLLSLSLFGGESQAAETLLRYDHYAAVGDAFFSDLGGLYAGECWATVFQPDEDDYPVKPTELHVLVGGDPDELLTTIRIWSYLGLADSAAMNAGLATELDREDVLLQDNEVTGTMHEIVLENHSFNLDPIEEGSIVVGVCFKNEQFMPMVGMDTDGYEEDEDTGSTGDMSSRYLILKGGGGGPWYSLDEYIPGGALLTDYATGGEFPPGDFVMRLVVDTRVELGDGGDGPSSQDAEIYTIEPDSQEAGRSVSVLIRGVGMDAGATANIGTLPLNAVSVTPFEGECGTGACCVSDACYDYGYEECKGAKGTTFQKGVSCMSSTVECATPMDVGACVDLLNGQTDKALEPGVYDVKITTSSGDEVLLPEAFTVAEVKGCGCSSAARGVNLGWLALIGLLWRRREG
jgi:hypothetical protein